jgi:ribosome-associated protein
MAKGNAPTGKTRRAGVKTGHAASSPTRNRPSALSKAGPHTAAPPASSAKAAPARVRPAARKADGRLPKPLAGAVRAALDKKAEDVVVLDLRKAGGFTDYFIICTGGNPRQITAIADAVRDVLRRDFDERPALSEGVDRSEWILLDYFNFVVHVFSRECRAFYGLERLWGNAERQEFSD